MQHFLTHCWQALSAPASRVRERFSARATPTPAHDANAGGQSTRAEQLEHIALYVRAGYFNLDYTVDALQAPIDTPPH